MKKTIAYFFVIGALLMTSCENQYRGWITERGHDIYADWCYDVAGFHDGVINPIFWINEYMYGTDSLAKVTAGVNLAKLDFDLYNDSVFYVSPYYYYTTLIEPAGDITVPGTAWTIDLIMGSSIMPFTITCMADGKWTLKDQEMNGERSFSIDCMFERYNITPFAAGKSEELTTIYGSGYYNIDKVKTTYAITDTLKTYGSVSSSYTGCVDIAIKQLSTGKELSVNVKFDEYDYELTYKGVTETYRKYNYGYY